LFQAPEIFHLQKLSRIDGNIGFHSFKYGHHGFNKGSGFAKSSGDGHPGTSWVKGSSFKKAHMALRNKESGCPMETPIAVFSLHVLS